MDDVDFLGGVEPVGACSPVGLPVLVWAWVGGRVREVLWESRRAAGTEMEPRQWGLRFHFTAGVQVRNAIRDLSSGWRDVELDDCWAGLVWAAMDELSTAEARRR
jgi:hypothetical protein